MGAISMELILERWRRYQLNELFNNPVEDGYITKLRDSPEASEWDFEVDDLNYNMLIHYGFQTKPSTGLSSWQVEFSHSGSYDPTDYGLETGIKVMSTVLKILMEWVQENSDNFFVLVSSSYGVNRTKLYNRALKNVTKKLGKDYVSESDIDEQLTINIGMVDRKVNNFIANSDFRSARKLVSDALTVLNHEGVKRGVPVQRILDIFSRIEKAQREQ